MKLYRIDWIYYEDKNWKEEFHDYEYVLGTRALGKAVYEGVRDGDKVSNIWELQFSWKGLKVCGKRTRSNNYNLTI